MGADQRLALALRGVIAEIEEDLFSGNVLIGPDGFVGHPWEEAASVNPRGILRVPLVDYLG